ncbi:MAG TPA: prenyltransferase/squalene oxidase repeat-containing protein [Phycisphaerae bacterium]|nr:prenyltransferase/squalene oxidase repeat-containing protein [Phycisphaerae bacterium]
MTIVRHHDPAQIDRRNLRNTPRVGDHPREKLVHVLACSQSRLLDRRIDGRTWNFNSHLGKHFISQYLVLTHWFGRKAQGLDGNRLRRELIQTQLPDGSWQQIPDVNSCSGELNATVFNYWALKVLGAGPRNTALRTARKFILDRGGLKATALFTQIILALFGNFSWRAVPYTPYVLFLERVPLNYKGFAQWVIPHLMSIAYLRHNRVHKNPGPSFALAELQLEPRSYADMPARTPNRFFDGALIHKILAHQQPGGSWGGYTLSTLFSMMALDHYASHFPRQRARLSECIEKGFGFIEDLYFGQNIYNGALMDGSDWDTILVAHGLLASGMARETLCPTADFVLSRQQSSGGFPFGRDFEYAPDTDDTAAAILMLSHWGTQYSRPIQKAVHWLCSMQSRDGGWGAFDRNNNINCLLGRLTRRYIDSVVLFDDSSADCTGHVLEAMGAAGLNAENSSSVRRGIEYLRSTQDSRTGAWIGRWGVNYLFGATAALNGLLAVGEPSDRAYIQRAITWLLDQQNPDGGFGESTDSYLSPTARVAGVSTPTQTAWVLYTLCRANLHTGDAARRAADYLIATHDKRCGWSDPSPVGTGHPGILYMNYPVYANVFPILALSLYARQTHDLHLAHEQMARDPERAHERAKTAKAHRHAAFA